MYLKIFENVLQVEFVLRHLSIKVLNTLIQVVLSMNNVFMAKSNPQFVEK
jgi:hypothetical protein